METWRAELVALWESVGVSMSRFAAANPIDKGTISRYLAGKRVPREAWFLNRLLALRAEQGREVSQAVRDHLTGLQLAALQAAHPGEYRVRLVSDRLELAEVARRETERYAQALHEQLADRQRQVDELTQQQATLHDAWDADRSERDAAIAELNQQIVTLAEQLDQAHRRRTEAEQRCQALERLLESVDGPGTTSGEDAPSIDVQLADILAEHSTLVELRTRADQGDQDATWRLAALLADLGQVDELRSRADDRHDETAAEALVKLLVKRGELEELRSRADRGDRYAARQLKDLLAKRADGELRSRADDQDDDHAAWLALVRGDYSYLRGDPYLLGDLDTPRPASRGGRALARLRAWQERAFRFARRARQGETRASPRP